MLYSFYWPCISPENLKSWLYADHLHQIGAPLEKCWDFVDQIVFLFVNLWNDKDNNGHKQVDGKKNSIICMLYWNDCLFIWTSCEMLSWKLYAI